MISILKSGNLIFGRIILFIILPQMQVDILDDPAVVGPIYDELKRNLALNVVQNLDHR